MEEKQNKILAELKSQLEQELLITSAEDLNVGDIIYVDMDSNDGLVLRQGYPTRLKYVVVAGSKTNNKEFGVVLINSSADYSDDADWIADQHVIHRNDYPEILDYDSYIDCTDPKELSLRKIKAKKAIKKGKLTDSDLSDVMKKLKNSDFVEEHFKKIYGIYDFCSDPN